MKLRTENVEWVIRRDFGMLGGASDHVASYERQDGSYHLVVYDGGVHETDGKIYYINNNMAQHITVHESLESVQAECVRALVACGLLDPLDLIMDITCNASS